MMENKNFIMIDYSESDSDSDSDKEEICLEGKEEICDACGIRPGIPLWLATRYPRDYCVCDVCMARMIQLDNYVEETFSVLNYANNSMDVFKIITEQKRFKTHLDWLKFEQFQTKVEILLNLYHKIKNKYD